MQQILRLLEHWFSQTWRCAKILIALSLLLWSFNSQALPSSTASGRLPTLFEGNQQLALDVPMGFIVLSNAKALDPEQLLQMPLAEQFKPWQPGMKLPTSRFEDVWLRLELPAQARPQSWMLRIPRLTLEKATLYQRAPHNPSVWHSQSAGLDVPNTHWPIRARDPIFEISTRSDQTQLFFIHLQNTFPVTENIQLIHSSDFGNGANRAGTLNGLIIGIFSILFVLAAANARINRNAHFGWFALLCLTMMMALLSSSGHLFLRVWPDSVYLAKTMGWVLPFISLAALARFALSISQAQHISRAVYWVLWGQIGLCLLISSAILVVPESFPREPLNGIYAAGMLLVLGALMLIAQRLQTWIWWVVGCLIPVMLSVLTRLAYNLGWVAHMELALLAGVITAALGLLGIFAALVFHQRQLLLATQLEDELETKDPASGLFNDRVARSRLPQIILRSKRFEKPCGAIMVRWLDFVQVMSPGLATDRARVIAHLGDRLRRLARDIDTIARLDDDHFIYLLESPVTREQLNALASHILTTCMRESTLMPDKKGFQLHLAIWISDDLPAEAMEVYELLRTRLNHMRTGTQRRVQFIDSAFVAGQVREATNAQDLVAKINAIEATQGLPSIHLNTPEKSP